VKQQEGESEDGSARADVVMNLMFVEQKSGNFLKFLFW
jgi:hypothetical protein